MTTQWWRLGIATVLLLLAAGPAVQASLVVNESFNYSTGNLDGQNGGSGWNGGWIAGSNTTPTYEVVTQDIVPPVGYGTPIGNQAYIEPNATNDDAGGATPDIRRLLNSPIDLDATQTLYFSMLIRREDATDGGGTEHNFYLRLNDASGTFRAGVGHESNEAFRMAFNDATTKDISSTVTMDIGVDYLLVAKLVTNPGGGTDTFSASLFSGSDSLAEPATWDLSLSGDYTGVMAQFQIGTQRRAGRSYVDEIRIGTEYGDVIPEPATLGLLAAAGLLLRPRRSKI